MTDDPQPPLAETCGHLLRLALQAHNAHWAAEVGGEPTSPQYALLIAIEAQPGIDQRRAGELASLDTSSTMDVVARLERRGHLARGRDPRDGRRHSLTLTDAARTLLVELHPRVQQVQELLLSRVPPASVDGLLRDLAALARLDSVIDSDIAADAPPRLPGHLVRRAQQVHTALFAEVFGAELTGPQFAVLRTLDTGSGLSQSDVGAQAGLDKSTAADLVDRLARRGWIARHPDAVDRRRRIVALTGQGRAALGEAAPRVGGIQLDLLEPVDVDRRSALLTHLALVAAA